VSILHLAATPSPVPSPFSIAPTSDDGSGAVLEFIASIVGSIAWPVVVLTLFLLFRLQLHTIIAGVAARIPNLLRFKVAGTEAEFDRQVAVLAEDVQDQRELRDSRRSLDEDSPKTDKILDELALQMPNAAVAGAFIEVEVAARKYLDVVQDHSKLPPAQTLRRRQEVPGGLRSALHELFDLRNRAIHGRDNVLPSSARTYVQAARDVVHDIEAITRLQEVASEMRSPSA
jgi:hypothetical protein